MMQTNLAQQQNNTAPPPALDLVRLYEGERLAFRQREDITVSQWAARYRYVNKGPRQGLWTNEYTPYAVMPMDCWNRPWVRKIYLCWSPQTAKTQFALNCLAYTVDQDPQDFMYVMADEKTVKRKSRGTIIPMLQSSPRLAALLSERADDTSMSNVRFRNGMELMIAWATSAAALASESVPYIVFDETNKYPKFVGDEADPVSLGSARATAFPETCKLLHMSTPTSEDGIITNLIEKDAEEIYDYYAVCPYCGQAQIMHFEDIRWPESVRDHRTVTRGRLAKYSCTQCEMFWDDNLRNQAVLAGHWQPRTAVHRATAVAFHLPSWYSRNVSLSTVAADWMRAKEDLGLHYFFITNHKAEAWKETVKETKESAVLEHKTELPEGIVPRGAAALTCGIDVQKRGFWFVVRAWWSDLTSHMVQYGYLDTWSDVETILYETQYQVEGSTERKAIWRAGMDIGGGESEDGEWSRTEEIKQWLRRQALRGVVYGTKGASREQLRRVQVSVIDKANTGKRTRIPGGLELRMLDTAQFKDLVHWRLSRSLQPINDGGLLPGVQSEYETQRFYLHAGTGSDYARQLLAEEKRKERTGKSTWVRVRKDNHLLDCEVIAAACADNEWTPSLSFLAQCQDVSSQQQKQPETAQPADPAAQAQRSRPSWRR